MRSFTVLFGSGFRTNIPGYNKTKKSYTRNGDGRRNWIMAGMWNGLRKVTRFFHCRFWFRAHAEYNVCWRWEKAEEGLVALKPLNMTYDEAALLPEEH